MLCLMSALGCEINWSTQLYTYLKWRCCKEEEFNTKSNNANKKTLRIVIVIVL